MTSCPSALLSCMRSVASMHFASSELHIYGVRHNFEQDNKDLAFIERHFRSLRDVKIALIEGVENLSFTASAETRANAWKHFRAMSLEERIKRLGERGIMIGLCEEYKIPLYSPEPRRPETIQHLLNCKELPQDIYMFLVARYLDQFARRVEGGEAGLTFRAELDDIVMFLNRELGAGVLSDHGFQSGLDVVGYFRDVHGLQIETLTSGDWINVLYPDDGSSSPSVILGRIGRESLHFRDREIVRHTVHALLTFGSAFMLYGMGHLVPILRGVSEHTDTVL